jgi:hypothetical protein
MSNATLAQVFHINRMFLNGILSRIQFEEFNRMAADGHLTEDVAQRIIERRFAFKNYYPNECLFKARTVWMKLGERVFGVSFEQYLNGTDNLEAIPALPDWPASHVTVFDRDVLVDGRVIERVGLRETCRLVGVLYNGRNDTFVAYDQARAKTGVRWMHAQTGRKNRNRAPADCRKSFVDVEVGMDVNEGVFAYVDDPFVVNDHHMDLPGSVHHIGQGTPYIGDFDDGPELRWNFGASADPRYGSASRAE